MAEGTGLQNPWTNIPRQFESDSHLLHGEHMKKINVENINNIMTVVICVLTIVILTVVLIIGGNEKVLQGGNIAHAIETGQYR